MGHWCYEIVDNYNALIARCEDIFWFWLSKKMYLDIDEKDYYCAHINISFDKNNDLIKCEYKGKRWEFPSSYIDNDKWMTELEFQIKEENIEEQIVNIKNRFANENEEKKLYLKLKEKYE